MNEYLKDNKPIPWLNGYVLGPAHYLWPDGSWRLEEPPNLSDEEVTEMVLTKIDKTTGTITYTGTPKE